MQWLSRIAPQQPKNDTMNTAPPMMMNAKAARPAASPDALLASSSVFVE